MPTYGLIVILLLAGSLALNTAQTPNSSSSPGRGVVRLRVKVREGETLKGLARKRFFLVKGTLQQNNLWLKSIEQQPLVSRDCYYRSLGASEQLIRWLKENDCESVYCRQITSRDVEGPDAVPEFQRAASAGQGEFHNPETSRRWLTVNLADNIREGFYKTNRERLTTIISEAERVSGARVLSVMTDRNGTAYFTDLEPGTYVLSNMIASEIGTSGVTWGCEVQVKIGDLFSEKPLLISNRNERNVKCVGVERPLPVCAGGK